MKINIIDKYKLRKEEKEIAAKITEEKRKEQEALKAKKKKRNIILLIALLVLNMSVLLFLSFKENDNNVNNNIEVVNNRNSNSNNIEKDQEDRTTENNTYKNIEYDFCIMNSYSKDNGRMHGTNYYLFDLDSNNCWYISEHHNRTINSRKTVHGKYVGNIENKLHIIFDINDYGCDDEYFDYIRDRNCYYILYDYNENYMTDEDGEYITYESKDEYISKAINILNLYN